jgi:phospholipase/carboxylesterase
MNTSQLYYLIREPMTKNPTNTNKAIILLHGDGSNEQDLFGLADQLQSHFYILGTDGMLLFD